MRALEEKRAAALVELGAAHRAAREGAQARDREREAAMEEAREREERLLDRHRLARVEELELREEESRRLDLIRLRRAALLAADRRRVGRRSRPRSLLDERMTGVEDGHGGRRERAWSTARPADKSVERRVEVVIPTSSLVPGARRERTTYSVLRNEDTRNGAPVLPASFDRVVRPEPRRWRAPTPTLVWSAEDRSVLDELARVDRVHRTLARAAKAEAAAEASSADAYGAGDYGEMDRTGARYEARLAREEAQAALEMERSTSGRRRGACRKGRREREGEGGRRGGRRSERERN